MNHSMKTRLYCAGGGATNIGQQLDTQMSRCYIDTSQSNRTRDLPADDCFFIPDLDGAGQDRRQNYRDIAPAIAPIIERFTPGDFNIVLFTAGGGSGSVIGPLIMRYLLEHGHTAVAVAVGADDTKKAVENTLGTIKTLETQSATLGQPVVVSYHENAVGQAYHNVDDDVLFALHALERLSDQDNHGLDTADVHNWTQFQRVTGFHPQLASLLICDQRKEAAAVVEPIAAVSLYRDRDLMVPYGNAAYHTNGFPRSGDLGEVEQLHFIINTADLEGIVSHLTERQVELNKAHSGYRQRQALTDVDDDVTEDGMVF